MHWFTIVIVSYATVIEAQPCADKPYTKEAKLENDLLSAYPNPNEPPLMNATDVIRVKVELIPEYFRLDDAEEFFYLHTWLFLFWTDPFLSWNPAEYDGIEDTTIDFYKVWDPMGIIADYTEGRKSYHSHASNSINSRGHVIFSTRFTEMIKCKINMRKWPYDTQLCTYVFGETIKEWKRVSFSLSTITQRPTFEEPGPGWKMNSIKQTDLEIVYPCSNNTEAVFHTIKFTFEIRREAAGLAAIIVIPCLTLVSLTVVAQALDLDDHPRFVLILFGMYGHFYFLQEINISIPMHGRETPLVIIFIFSSLTITCISLFTSLFLKKMHKNNFFPPYWMVTIVQKIRRNNIPERIDNDESVNSKTSLDTVNWVDMMNGICVIIFLIAYLILIITTLPMSF